jgi:disulfide bond formation protein DsbB
MGTNKIGFWLAHLFVLAYCVVLIAAFGVQFIKGEYPCPLCMLQRMAMVLATLGPAYVIAKTRNGDVSLRDYATGYGLSIVAAVAGGLMSTRQVLLHVVPPDPGYGEPVLGLHMYTWALITFVVVIVFCGISMIFADELVPRGVEFGIASKLVLGLFLGIVAAELVTTFLLEGFNWFLPDNPSRYEIFY